MTNMTRSDVCANACVISQAWAASEGRQSTSSRSLRVVQVGSRLEKNSTLGKHNASHIELLAMDRRLSSGQAYSDSKRALLLYTAHMSTLHAGQSPAHTRTHASHSEPDFLTTCHEFAHSIRCNQICSSCSLNDICRGHAR